MSNVVIMVWNQHMNAGFGDLLRGTIYLHKLSRLLNFELIVDTQLYPVSKLLVSPPHRFTDYVVEHQSEINDAINKTGEHVKQLIEMNQGGTNPLLITTNFIDDYIHAPSNECKLFMRAHLIPTHEFNGYFNERCKAFRISKNYSIAHFRLGDQELNDKESNVHQYRQLCAMINVQLTTVPNLYIMSDSLQFKTHLRERIRPELVHRVIPTHPIHLADPNADIDSMRETMFDFMLLTNACVIKTHSRYHWVSGFVNWVSHIFNVPLVDLKSTMTMKTCAVPRASARSVEVRSMPLFRTNHRLRMR
jgi:hypothetical protein